MKTVTSILMLGAALTLTACQHTAPAQTLSVNTATPKKAKNVILFIGDGMGLSTITAARIFDGQSKGMSGEENQLSFETFENVALVKTYNLDSQVADSAGTASAMNTGIKTQIGKINVTAQANDAGCAGSPNLPPATIADLAKDNGLSVGVVSTARLTHATAAAVYGHARLRGFESDKDLDDAAKEKGCTDLAAQLITSDIDIALGGGLSAFQASARDDKADLIAQWNAKSEAHTTVTDSRGLRGLLKTGLNILGLFTNSHMSFETDRDDDEEPSLTEMTTLAIENLSARDTGYYLMVEAGRIDHAHHDTNAYRALSETQELARAVQAAMNATNPDETLILVTADHSHVFTIAGYPARGNPILGLVNSSRLEGYSLDNNGKPFTTLGYHNGPNVVDPEETLTQDMVLDKDFQQRTAIAKDSETHAGEDVILYGQGIGAQNVRGVIDQTEIFTIITDALGVTP